jgi:hypothetical protein
MMWLCGGDVPGPLPLTALSQARETDHFFRSHGVKKPLIEATRTESQQLPMTKIGRKAIVARNTGIRRE